MQGACASGGVSLGEPRTASKLAHFVPADTSIAELPFSAMKQPFKFRYQNDDPFFADVDAQREIEQMAYGSRTQTRYAVHEDVYDIAMEQNEGYSERIPCNFTGCRTICASLREYEQHYRLAHMHTCNECRTSFSSNRLLDIHISERHDSYFASLSKKQPMYVCIVEGCDGVFWGDGSRSQHLAAKHGYPKGFLLHRKPRQGRHKKQSKVPQEQRQACKFFNTRSGCKFGDKCNFLHVTGGNEDVDMAEEECVEDELSRGVQNIHIPDTISFGRRGRRGAAMNPRRNYHKRIKPNKTPPNTPNDYPMEGQ